MPLYTCDLQPLGLTPEFAMEIPAPNYSGSVLVDCMFDWDGLSVWPDCNGPVTLLRVRNTSNVTAWALLPDKKKGSPWVQGNPGTDLTITQATKGQSSLSSLGLTNALDVKTVTITFTQPV